MAGHLAEAGFTVHDSDSNFVLFGNIASPADLWQKLLDRGVLIRDIGITGHARVNAGTEEETEAFLTAIDEILAEDPDILFDRPQSPTPSSAAPTKGTP